VEGGPFNKLTRLLRAPTDRTARNSHAYSRTRKGNPGMFYKVKAMEGRLKYLNDACSIVPSSQSWCFAASSGNYVVQHNEFVFQSVQCTSHIFFTGKPCSDFVPTLFSSKRKPNLSKPRNATREFGPHQTTVRKVCPVSLHAGQLKWLTSIYPVALCSRSTCGTNCPGHWAERADQGPCHGFWPARPGFGRRPAYGFRPSAVHITNFHTS